MTMVSVGKESEAKRREHRQGSRRAKTGRVCAAAADSVNPHLARKI